MFLLKSLNWILVKNWARVLNWQLAMNRTANANTQNKGTITGKLHGLLALNTWSSFDTKPCKLSWRKRFLIDQRVEDLLKRNTPWKLCIGLRIIVNNCRYDFSYLVFVMFYAIDIFTKESSLNNFKKMQNWIEVSFRAYPVPRITKHKRGSSRSCWKYRKARHLQNLYFSYK